MTPDTAQELRECVDAQKALIEKLRAEQNRIEKVLWILQEAGHLDPGKLAEACKIVDGFFGGGKA